MNQTELKNMTISLSVAVEAILKSTSEADAAEVANICNSAIKQIIKDNPKLKDSLEDLLLYSAPELESAFYEWIEWEN